MAAKGIVTNQAQTMRSAIFHLMDEKRVVAPTPTIAPVIVWVVDTGTPRWVAKNKVAAPDVSAQKPPTGFNLVIFIPIVFTMRQPPKAVPRMPASSEPASGAKGTAIRLAAERV